MSNAIRIVNSGVLLCGSLALLFVCGCANRMTTSTTNSSLEDNLAAKVVLHGWHNLSVELENESVRPIKLDVNNLPWEWRYSMWLKAFEDNATGSPLDERIIPADPPINTQMKTLLPGKPVSGEIDLRGRFPDLEEVLRRRNVIVFWSYVPELEGPITNTRLSGFFVIPKFR